jgi:UDP-N-acetylmuramate: L-alanyl-gamma-D-glutamyl-meso-diaminopimelate ligase
MERPLIFTPGPNIRKIHLIAICGTGMGALAGILKDLGYSVTGSDQHIYPPMSDFLAAKAIPIFNGFQPTNLDVAPDLVVIGNAVSKDNPEVQALEERKLPYCSMPQAVNAFAAAGKRQIVVTGTHGKTTTTAFIAWLLMTAGLDPSFLIGGLVTNFNSNYRVGHGSWVVLEGDEYDTAFFDKGSKFLHFQPDLAVVTSIEFDHADIFSDLDAIQAAFGKFIANLSPASLLIAFDSDNNIKALFPKAACKIATYGHDHNSTWQLGRYGNDSPFTIFEILRQGKPFGQFKTRMMGVHNLGNLMAGIAVGHHLCLDNRIIAEALETFRGVRRRQEVRGEKNGILVLDDFAHHPTAVKATINAVKSFYPSRRLIAVFEPRTNSSRRNIFQQIYPAAFMDADLVCVRHPPLLEKIPAHMRFSSQQLVADLISAGKQAFYFPDTESILNYLSTATHSGDVVLIMSNGGFDNIHEKLLNLL